MVLFFGLLINNINTFIKESKDEGDSSGRLTVHTLSQHNSVLLLNKDIDTLPKGIDQEFRERQLTWNEKDKSIQEQDSSVRCKPARFQSGNND